jgi:hypothetical protein
MNMRGLLVILTWLVAITAAAQDTSVSYTRKGRPYKRLDYVEDLSDMINVAPFVSKSTTGFILSGAKSIEYFPNEGVTLGVKLQHKWLGLALAYSPKKLQDESIGQSDFINIVLNSYGKQLGFDLYYLNYRGYYVRNTGALQRNNPPPPDDRNPNNYRYDLNTTNTGLNVYYLFNGKKYSYRSTFLHNEWQKKSAGSFLVTASFNYYRLSGDSTMVPVRYDDRAGIEQARLKSGDFYSFCLMPGYAHTFVIFKRFFITLVPSTGIMLQTQNYITENNLNVERQGVNIRSTGRIGVGFNSRRFYCGFSYIGDVYDIQLAKEYRISNQINSSILFAGVRLGVPKSLKKYSDFLGKCDPVNILSIGKSN